MSETEIVLFPGKAGDEDGNGWLPSLVLDHDGNHELYIIVMDEAEGMAEHVPPEVFEAVRTRLTEGDRYREALETIRDSCADWSNDDIRDQCRVALDA